VTLISCRNAVTISGTINAGGGGGGPGFALFAAIPGFGGGAGGYVVLQAKTIAVTGRMFANGGGGGAGMRASSANGSPGNDGSLSATVAAQGGFPQDGEGFGGKGGTGTDTPGFGGKPTSSPATAGGGGGSVGFFQTYTPEDHEPVLAPAELSPSFQPNGRISTR
jgi:hypothetical protein